MTTPAGEATAVPLIERLRAVPANGRLLIQGDMWSHSYPVGPLCHEAADAIEGRASTATASPQPADLTGRWDLRTPERKKCDSEHLTERSALQPEAPCEDLAIKALAELVTCEDLRQRISTFGSTEVNTDAEVAAAAIEWEALRVEYDRRQPLAWKAAREALP